MEKDDILPYVEPIFRFCYKRLNNRYDAEDLASEIISCILEGMQKYQIDSPDAWVWRIAHNRYARFIDRRNRTQTVLTGDDAGLDILCEPEDCFDDEPEPEEYEPVFRYLHTLSAEYRDIFVDYYLGELSVRALSEKYALPETTVKWRLNTGRQKIRNRIGEHTMEKVYKRIHWNTKSCNGSMDPDRYLHTQISRAICQAAYEKPLTVEEISLATGIPAMYIEDELPRLEYGDAVCRVGNKYATNFIIFRLEDRKNTEDVSAKIVGAVADKFEALLTSRAEEVRGLSFYGHDFGMERLGFLLIPKILRSKIEGIKTSRLKLENGPYPPRKDGGHGWFIVEETADESEGVSEYNTGCNVAWNDAAHIYYYWFAKYFDWNIYGDRGTRWLCANGIPQNAADGRIGKEALTDENAVALLRNNLIVKAEDGYRLNFACFTREAFEEFVSLFGLEDEALDGLLAEWILTVRKNFKKFVPARLESQINPWLSFYLFRLTGYVVEELIRRGVLGTPDAEKPLTDGVFYVEGEYMDL